MERGTPAQSPKFFQFERSVGSGAGVLPSMLSRSTAAACSSFDTGGLSALSSRSMRKASTPIGRNEVGTYVVMV